MYGDVAPLPNGYDVVMVGELTALIIWYFDVDMARRMTT